MTPAELRALAHPLRVQLLQLLHAEGPSTASALARRLGESSGATSYHLRALHRAGMVEEAEQRNGRERWWQRVRERTLIPNSIPPELGEPERSEYESAHAQLESVFVERDEQALSRWQAIRYEVPLEWQDAGFIGNFKVWGTPEEIQALVQDVLERSEALRSADRDRGAREVHVTLRVLLQEE
jgi:DNA-binding transcriptional ArsR family regulator